MQGTPQQAMPQQAMPQQGAIYVQEKQKFTLFTPTGGEWVSSIYIVLGLICWIVSWSFMKELEFGTANTCTGFAWMFFFAGIVNAAHCVEKAIRNSD
jgi:hypothetical protein